MICALCRNARADGTLLLCDSCDAGCHLSCLGLDSVPPGDWHCPQCAPTDSTRRRRAAPAAASVANALGGSARSRGARSRSRRLVSVRQRRSELAERTQRIMDRGARLDTLPSTMVKDKKQCVQCTQSKNKSLCAVCRRLLAVEKLRARELQRQRVARMAAMSQQSRGPPPVAANRRAKPFSLADALADVGTLKSPKKVSRTPLLDARLAAQRQRTVRPSGGARAAPSGVPPPPPSSSYDPLTTLVVLPPRLPLPPRAGPHLSMSVAAASSHALGDASALGTPPCDTQSLPPIDPPPPPPSEPIHDLPRSAVVATDAPPQPVCAVESPPLVPPPPPPPPSRPKRTHMKFEGDNDASDHGRKRRLVDKSKHINKKQVAKMVRPILDDLYRQKRLSRELYKDVCRQAVHTVSAANPSLSPDEVHAVVLRLVETCDPAL